MCCVLVTVLDINSLMLFIFFHLRSTDDDPLFVETSEEIHILFHLLYNTWPLPISSFQICQRTLNTGLQPKRPEYF